MSSRIDNIDLDELAELLGIPTWEKFSEHFEYGDSYQYAYKQVINDADEDADEEEVIAAAEEAGQEAEHEAEAEVYRNYYDALMHAAEKTFEKFHLQLIPRAPASTKRGRKIGLDGLEISYAGEQRLKRQAAWRGKPIRLRFVPRHTAYAYFYGDTLLRLDGEPSVFRNGYEAVEAGKKAGLACDEDGNCTWVGRPKP
jgi:hypothetical protein